MSKYAAAIWPGNGNILKLPTFKWQGQVTRLAIQNIVPFILSIQNFKWYHHSISSNRSPSGIWWELTLIYIYTVYPVSHAKRDYIMYIFPKNLRTNNINNSKYKNHIPNHHIKPMLNISINKNVKLGFGGYWKTITQLWICLYSKKNIGNLAIVKYNWFPMKKHEFSPPNTPLYKPMFLVK